MRKIIIFLALNLLFIGISFGQDTECGDGIVYVNEQQIQYTKRLSAYPKIKSVPTYYYGKNELNKLIESNLKVNEKAKNIVFLKNKNTFLLNYKFTITCDGQVKDFKTPAGARIG